MRRLTPRRPPWSSFDRGRRRLRRQPSCSRERRTFFKPTEGALALQSNLRQRGSPLHRSGTRRCVLGPPPDRPPGVRETRALITSSPPPPSAQLTTRESSTSPARLHAHHRIASRKGKERKGRQQKETAIRRRKRGFQLSGACVCLRLARASHLATRDLARSAAQRSADSSPPGRRRLHRLTTPSITRASTARRPPSLPPSLPPNPPARSAGCCE